MFYLVSAHEPNQAYFMIGYRIAFVAKLYEATADEVYLRAARNYVEFALSCEDNLLWCASPFFVLLWKSRDPFSVRDHAHDRTIVEWGALAEPGMCDVLSDGGQFTYPLDRGVR